MLSKVKKELKKQKFTLQRFFQSEKFVKYRFELAFPPIHHFVFAICYLLLGISEK